MVESFGDWIENLFVIVNNIFVWFQGIVEYLENFYIFRLIMVIAVFFFIVGTVYKIFNMILDFVYRDKEKD